MENTNFSADNSLSEAVRRRGADDTLETAPERGIEGEGASSFASRWRGRFGPAESDDPRYKALAKKYLR